MRITKFTYPVVFLLFLFSNFLLKITAQDINLNFFHLTSEDGLSDNSVNSISIDKDGFIWIGTNVGLNRYDGYKFRTFTQGQNKNSLPNNEVNNLFVTSFGELWLSPFGKGVCRYDPTTENFTNFDFTKKTNSVDANFIANIVEDSDSILYVATKDGVFYKKKQDSIFYEISQNTYPKKKSENNNQLNKTVATLIKDEKKGIWIIFENWDIAYYNHKKNIIEHYSITLNNKTVDLPNVSSGVHRDGKLWIGSLNYTFICFDPNQNSYTEPLAESRIVSYYQLLQGKQKDILWMATTDGLMRYNILTGKLDRYTNMLTNSSSLSATPVSCIYETTDNMLWVGTNDAGINYAYLDRPFKHLYVIKEENYALSEENVTSILHDSKGDTWFAYIGGTIEWYRSKNESKITVPIKSIKNPWGAGTVFKLFEDNFGNIYACSWSGGVQIFDYRTLQFIPMTGSSDSFLKLFNTADFRDIEEDSEGNFWLVGHGKGIFIYNPKEKTAKIINEELGLSNNWAYNIEIDKDGNIWVGTAWGLSKIDPETFEVQKYFNIKDDTTSIIDNQAEYVKVTDDKNIWIGTRKGLNLYNKYSDNFYQFDKKYGLPEVFIRSIEQDNDGGYWVSTTNGLINFKLKYIDNLPHLDNIFSFTVHDGLLSGNYNLNSSSIDGDGFIFMGNKKGIDYFDPKSIKPTVIKPKLKITQNKILGKTVYPGSLQGPQINKDGYIKLTYKQNILDFEYVAIHFSGAHSDNFSYKLNPLHTNWIDVENNRNIHFSNLNPGNYKLSLKVSTEKGISNIEEDIIKFHIKPPFWETQWFKYLSILTIIFLVIFIIRIYTANLRQNKIQLEKTVHQRTLELQQNNKKLEEQSIYLNETNTLLEERQQYIEEQSEELKAQSEKLAKTNEELEKLIAMKDKFFSIVAHDLKNPFNTILGFSELLHKSYDKYSEEKRKRTIEYIITSAKSAFSLLENLLNWSRAQTSRFEVKPEMLMVAHIIEINYGLIRATIKKKKLNFEANYDKKLKVWADGALLNTIVRNLLSNATKFTPEGGKVTLNVVKLDEKIIRFEINDTGIGLSEKEIDSLFKIDSKISKTGTSGERGTGLGMLLCKEFIDKLNGDIWIKSKENVGTSVFFTLPANSNTKRNYI